VPPGWSPSTEEADPVGAENWLVTGSGNSDEPRRRREAAATRLRRSLGWPSELERRARELEARIDRVLDASDGADTASGSGRS
jgi:hypothetical protein